LLLPQLSLTLIFGRLWACLCLPSFMHLLLLLLLFCLLCFLLQRRRALLTLGSGTPLHTSCTCTLCTFLHASISWTPP